MTIPTGTRLGRYEIRSLLGTGGMGEVYLARDTTLRRAVAIKILPVNFTAEKDNLDRFEREAYTASSLNHPNILTIYEIGVEEERHFIATEFIDGESLRHRVGRAELHEILDAGIQVASALAAAHAAGIMHRDVKPENIMLRRDRIVKVLDFGLAKLVHPETASSDGEAPTMAMVTTDPDIVMGTMSYMSPEQMRGMVVDARTDIWSLGVVLYEMVTGRVPFEGTGMGDIIGLILHKEPMPLARFAPDVPAELERIVSKALRKDREERYQLVKDLGQDLKSLKQRLEFEAELERTGAFEKNFGTKPRAFDGDSIAETIKMSASPISGRFDSTANENRTALAGGTHTTTQFGNNTLSPSRASSAEYIASEIKQHKRGTAVVLATLLMVFACVAYFSFFAQTGKAEINSIAVLPFANTGNDPNTEYLSDGISENLINNLSQLPQLKVIARNSTFKYKGKDVDLREAAAALGVEAIVTGRIVQRGEQLIVSAELVDARDGTQMWGEKYNRQAGDVQSVQADIARIISGKLRLRLSGEQSQQLAKRATENTQAYQLYLNGSFYRSKGGIENARKALEYHNQAIALDPEFALAYAAVAEVYNYLGGGSGLDPKEATPKATAAAEKALELDETLVEAHAALASIKKNRWDWSGAEEEYRRTIELNPSLAAAHGAHASHLSTMGRTEEALAAAKRAQELDPLSVRFKIREATVLYFARRYDQAINQLKSTIAAEPDNIFALNFLGYAHAAKGEHEQAIAYYQKAISIEGKTTSVQIYLGYACAMSGKRAEALAILDELKRTKDYVSPSELAILYAALGDKESALQSLERAYAERDLQLQYLKVDPHYDSLRSEARFANIIRRVGFTA
jgi:serine/threonine protein kinase/Tfp pilus assembly protein PilF